MSDANPLPSLAEFAKSIEPLHADLKPHVVIDGSLGPGVGLLRHPLVVGIVALGTEAALNRFYEQKRERIAQYVKERDLAAIVGLHERPFRLAALVQYEEFIGGPEKWELVAGVYADSENVHQDYDEWLRLFTEALPHREHLMDESERAALAALPEVVTIYRGAPRREDKDGPLGLSWTLSRSRALWFARRFPHRGAAYVLTATVRREDIVACFKGRNEDEVIALPSTLTGVTATRTPVRSRNT